MGKPLRFTRTDQVAEYMAEGLTPAEIAARMNIPRSYVDTVMHRIRKYLGWQAS